METQSISLTHVRGHTYIYTHTRWKEGFNRGDLSFRRHDRDYARRERCRFIGGIPIAEETSDGLVSRSASTSTLTFLFHFDRPAWQHKEPVFAAWNSRLSFRSKSSYQSVRDYISRPCYDLLLEFVCPGRPIFHLTSLLVTSFFILENFFYHFLGPHKKKMDILRERLMFHRANIKGEFWMICFVDFSDFFLVLSLSNNAKDSIDYMKNRENVQKVIPLCFH